MSRTYWVSWWSLEESEKVVPFEEWITGQNLSNDALSYCALVQGDGIAEVKRMVRAYYPEADFRFCDEKEIGWRPPGDRFPAALNEGDEKR